MMTRAMASICLILCLCTGARATEPSGKEFLIGLMPEQNIFRQVMEHMPLARFLERKLGMPVRFTILTQYPDVLIGFKSRSMDAAFFGSYAAVLAQDRLGAIPLARPISLQGSTQVQSYIITRKAMPTEDVRSLKGQRAVFVDETTSTGYLYALSYLNQHGIGNPWGFFSEVSFAGSHEAVVHAVASGRADLGSVRSSVFERMVKRDPAIAEEVAILAKSGPLPDVTLCVRGTMDEALKGRLKAAFLEMNLSQEGRLILADMGLSGYKEAWADDFASVRELMRSARGPLGHRRAELP